MRREPEKEWLACIRLRFDEFGCLLEYFHIIMAAEFVADLKSVGFRPAEMRFTEKSGEVPGVGEPVG